MAQKSAEEVFREKLLIFDKLQDDIVEMNEEFEKVFERAMQTAGSTTWSMELRLRVINEMENAINENSSKVSEMIRKEEADEVVDPEIMRVLNERLTDNENFKNRYREHMLSDSYMN